MTEGQILALAGQWGGWFVGTLLIVYVAINKLGPGWIDALREQNRLKAQTFSANQAELGRVYERMLSQLEANARFTSMVAMSISGMERALDANTQQLARVTQIVQHGPACPLPDCPFIGKEKNEA